MTNCVLDAYYVLLAKILKKIPEDSNRSETASSDRDQQYISILYPKIWNKQPCFVLACLFFFFFFSFNELVVNL